MNGILRILGIAVIVAIIVFSKNPRLFTKMVRHAVGPERPTTEQLEWQAIVERVNRSQQLNPPTFGDGDRAKIKALLNN